MASARQLLRGAARVVPALALALAVAPAGPAQDGAAFEELFARLHVVRERGYVALEQAIGDAGTDRLALIVAAHPDDRWFLPAAYLRRKLHWRVATLLFTRGEGGQNSSGPETGDELGAIRTLEAETSAAMLDVELYWLNRLDAGYCRTADEAMRVWGYGTVGDVARVLRRLRPDVILTTHHPQETHGHDLAVARILPAAVELALNAEFTTGLPPIRPPRVFRGATKDEAADVTLQTDEIDPVRGETYRRQAYRAFAVHRSAQPFQPIDELFEPALRLLALPFRGAEPGLAKRLEQGLPSLFDGANGPGAEALQRDLVEELRGQRGHERRLARFALDLRRRLAERPLAGDGDAGARLERRREALARVVQHAAALSFDVEVQNGGAAVPGEDLGLRIRLHNGGGLDFSDVIVSAVGDGQLILPSSRAQTLAARTAQTWDATYRVPRSAPDRAGLLRQLFQQLQFVPPVRLAVRLTADGETLEYPIAVPTDVRAPVELEVAPRALLFSGDGGQERLAVRVRRHTKGDAAGSLQVQAPAGFVVIGSPRAISLQHEVGYTFEFTLKAPPALKPGVYTVQVQLGAQRLEVPAHKVDVAVPAQLAVGLVKGVDDTAEAVLRGLNVRLVLLGDEDLAIRPLDDLQTILCDIRSLRRDGARAAFPRLLRFVEDGGRLVVGYHKDTEFNLATAGFRAAPYPLQLSKTARIARPDTKVEVRRPDHPLLQRPNLLQPEDWDGWVQERALYLPEQYAPEYEELLSMRDEATLAEENGALLYARHGKGDYVYCALALHRQLKMLHPGACRLFANMITPAR
jgi:LmbE family N-acetylglucosaminyl deacetylase